VLRLPVDSRPIIPGGTHDHSQDRPQ
jgi:hypothetical protein